MLLILWVSLVHLVAIYLFTSGFLLSRLALSDIAQTASHVSPTHSRALVLIIDSLRFDFVTPNPPSPVSPFHHNVLTVPRELTAKNPEHSFLFNAYADPPTTTLQRIKGITTGSLPTFIDVGNNFGASSIEEDSIIKQLQRAGKKLAFMGDDTWMSVFPKTFNITFAFDSFNVEDLHTVDKGVIQNLFPLLEDRSKPFDFLIGHFLGVDHVGHRVGPDHPTMKAKLLQMNDVLRDVVKKMDEDTLLVVLGDHGMDRAGDHGGDGQLETSSAMWIYSKGAPLMNTRKPIPSGLLQYKIFPGAPVRHRSIQQIDILPTLSLLLGLPIPYNNLGTIIPELFWRGDNGKSLESALESNAFQIMQYLDTYRASPHGGELEESWPGILKAWKLTQNPSFSGESRWVTLNNFTRLSLSACRSMWAQFNPLLMALGLSLLAMSLCSTWCLYVDLSSRKMAWKSWRTGLQNRLLFATLGGFALGVVGHFVVKPFVPSLRPWDLPLYLSGLVSTMTAIISCPPLISFSFSAFQNIPIILILHTLSFFSNSFVFWEERIVPFFLISSMIPYVVSAIQSPVARLRRRIVGYAVAFCVCVRLMAMSTVCREEQQPYCSITFFDSSQGGAPPKLIRYLALPATLGFIWAIRSFLKISRSEGGVGRAILPGVLLPSFIGGNICWLLEWIESASGGVEGPLGELHSRAELVRGVRTWLARASAVWLILGGALWFIIPLCLTIRVVSSPLATQTQPKKQVTVLGYANAYGAPYLLFLLLNMGLVWVCTQLTGQVTLGLGIVALLAYLEVLDSVRDSEAIRRTFEAGKPSALLSSSSSQDSNQVLLFYTPTHPFSLSTLTPVALLGIHAFFSTGHEATISSLQWKAAFVVNETVRYPWSPFTVVLNTLGGMAVLSGVGVGLVAAWGCEPGITARGLDSQKKVDDNNKEETTPNPQSDADTTETQDELSYGALLSSLALLSYYTALLLGASTSAAILRRHLMVWKVFAPRFMLGVVSLLAVDVGVLWGVGVGLARVKKSVRNVLSR